ADVSSERLVRTGKWGNALVRARAGPRVAGPAPSDTANNQPAEPAKHVRERENRECIGGMRDPARAVARMPLLQEAGRRVRGALECFLEKHCWVVRALLEGGADGWRRVEARVGQELAVALGEALGAESTGRSRRSAWRPGLVRAFVRAARDPEIHLADWLEHGAPTSVSLEIPSAGVFPRVETTGAAHHELRKHCALVEPGGNYASVEENEGAVREEIRRLAGKGFVTRYSSWEALLARFPDVIVSKMAAVVKARPDGSQKVRLIIDMLRSRVNEHVKMSERIVLPRLLDVLKDLMSLMEAPSARDVGVDMMVLDWEDAFHSVGVRSEELPHQIVRGFEGEFVGYETILFGGGGSPLVWGRTAAFLGRSGQALFSRQEARIQVYVDDPWTAWLGNSAQRARNKVILLLWWLTVGPPVSWRKVQFGTSVTWIGAEVRILGPSEAEQFLAVTVVPVARLRKLAGRAAWAGGILPYLKSMVAPLWAAITEVSTSARPGAAPAGVPRPRVAHALRWLTAFAKRQRGALSRTYCVGQYRQRVAVNLVFDASPWGYGGYIVVRGQVLSWFAEAVTAEDVVRLGIRVGDSRFQALLETLAILIGVREWLPAWKDERAAVVLRGDSQAALGATANLKSASPALNAVVRELSLDLAEGRYQVDVVALLAGKDNAWADALSRLHEPGGAAEVPRALLARPRTRPAKRDGTWWETMGGPELERSDGR
ncbi:unnamed protein product, partial [Prorocentrum cordatum]